MTIDYEPTAFCSTLCKRSGSVLFACPREQVKGLSPRRSRLVFPYLPRAILYSLICGAVPGLIAQLLCVPIVIAGRTFNDPPLYAVVSDNDPATMSPVADENLHVYVGFLIALLLLFRTGRSFDRYTDGVMMAKRMRTCVFDLLTETHRSFKLAEFRMRRLKRDAVLADREHDRKISASQQSSSRFRAQKDLIAAKKKQVMGALLTSRSVQSGATLKSHAQALRRASVRAGRLSPTPPITALDETHQSALLGMLTGARDQAGGASVKQQLFAVKKVRQRRKNVAAGLDAGVDGRGKGKFNTPATRLRLEKKKSRNRSLHRQDSLLRRLRNTHAVAMRGGARAGAAAATTSAKASAAAAAEPSDALHPVVAKLVRVAHHAHTKKKRDGRRRSLHRASSLIGRLQATNAFAKRNIDMQASFVPIREGAMSQRGGADTDDASADDDDWAPIDFDLDTTHSEQSKALLLNEMRRLCFLLLTVVYHHVALRHSRTDELVPLSAIPPWLLDAPRAKDGEDESAAEGGEGGGEDRRSVEEGGAAANAGAAPHDGMPPGALSINTRKMDIVLNASGAKHFSLSPRSRRSFVGAKAQAEAQAVSPAPALTALGPAAPGGAATHETLRGDSRFFMRQLFEAADTHGDAEPSSAASRAPIARPVLVFYGIRRLLARAAVNGQLAPWRLDTLESIVGRLIDAFECMSRVGLTQMPFPYVQILSWMVVLYVSSAPFGFVGTMGWLSPLAGFVLGAVFFGLESIAQELEDPLGNDANDIGLDQVVAKCHFDLDVLLENLMTELY